MRYAHVNVVARDFRRLASFYADVFGCVPLPPERDLDGDWLARGTGVARARLRGVHLQLPGCGPNGPTLEIFEYHETLSRPEPTANRQGLGHIAFMVESVPQTLARVLASGGRRVGDVVTSDVAGAGRLTFAYVRDPEGNLVELQQWETVAVCASGTLSVEGGYDDWAETYDSDDNVTRNLDAVVLQRLLPPLPGLDVVELGAGTGKNTGALLAARQVVAIDFSAGMLARARARHAADHLTFLRHDITTPLPLGDASYDLVTVDLVLEHVAELAPVIVEVARILRPGGTAVLVELHPFRQLRGAQAHFVNERGVEVRIPAFVHPISAHLAAAIDAGLEVKQLEEWLDDARPARERPSEMPRLLSLILRRP